MPRGPPAVPCRDVLRLLRLWRCLAWSRTSCTFSTPPGWSWYGKTPVTRAAGAFHWRQGFPFRSNPAHGACWRDRVPKQRAGGRRQALCQRSPGSRGPQPPPVFPRFCRSKAGKQRLFSIQPGQSDQPWFLENVFFFNPIYPQGVCQIRRRHSRQRLCNLFPGKETGSSPKEKGRVGMVLSSRSGALFRKLAAPAGAMRQTGVR